MYFISLMNYDFRRSLPKKNNMKGPKPEVVFERVFMVFDVRACVIELTRSYSPVPYLTTVINFNFSIHSILNLLLKSNNS
jgi:hypothetical protein